MSHIAIRLVAGVGACVLAFLLWTVAHIPRQHDIDIANAVAQEVMHDSGPFASRAQADRTGVGKALYAHPGAWAAPRLVIYEVTDPSERARIVQATRNALSQTHAHSATLMFYERQNVTHYPGGGMRRGPEHLLDTVEVEPAS